METADAYRTRGNELLAKGNLVEAIATYELGVKEFPTDGKFWRNLSHARLLNREFGKALKAADEALALEPDHPHSLLRVIRAKNELEVPWHDVLFENKPIENDFVGDVSVKHFGGGKGRGLISNRLTHEGELLLVARPLVVSSLGHHAFDKASATRDLVNKLINITNETRLHDLSDGLNTPNDNKNWSKVVETNAFQIDQRYALFHYPSFINHSCAPNCVVLFVGNVLVLRAGRVLNKDEEITIRYFPTMDLNVHQRRKRSNDNWKFICECAFCAFEEKLAKKTTIHEFHAKLFVEFDALSQQFFRNVHGNNTTELGPAFEKCFVQVEEFITKKQITGQEIGMVRCLFASGYQVYRALCESVQDIPKALVLQDCMGSIYYATDPASRTHCDATSLYLLFAETFQKVGAKRKLVCAGEQKRVFSMRYGYDPLVVQKAIELNTLNETNEIEWTIAL